MGEVLKRKSRIPLVTVTTYKQGSKKVEVKKTPAPKVKNESQAQSK